MDSIRTLLLACTHTVVLDPDRVADAATRPSRDVDVDRFEDELLQLGFVLSLDLAMTIRRLPYQTIQDLRGWMLETLTSNVGANRPHVPLAPGGTDRAIYLRRVLTWLATRPEQPCPWCGEVKPTNALDPCGHLVCTTCWQAGSFMGCPMCHRRIALDDPFVRPASPAPAQVEGHPGTLQIVHLAFDVLGVARARFEQLMARPERLSPAERAEVETVIDAIGPKAAVWLPARIPSKETMAIAVARLWLVAPDRSAMVRATQRHLPTATDVLRVTAVLMTADPALGEPMRLKSISRGLRRAVLEAVDRLAPDELIEDVMRHRGLWKRVGERLHPFEVAAKLPTAALAFAAVRGSDSTQLVQPVRDQLPLVASVRVSDNQVRVSPWAGPVERALREGDARAAALRLAERPGELLRRADHLVRVTCAKQPGALDEILAIIQHAMARGAPRLLLILAAHVSKRDAAWPRRVVFPGGELRRTWCMSDRRAALPGPAIASIAGAARAELLTRAESQRRFARAVIDRGLDDLLVQPRRGALGTRPTLWDVACIHAAARANVIYVRERGGRVVMVRRRDGETTAARLARLHDCARDHDGELTAIPPANAPTWVAVLHADLAFPAGSAGFVLDAGTAGTITRLSASDLIAALAAT